jgi:hypothetical protein
MLYWIESPATNNVRYTISLVFVIQMRLVRTVDPVDVFIREIKIYKSSARKSIFKRMPLCQTVCLLLCVGLLRVQVHGTAEGGKEKKRKKNFDSFLFLL